MADTTLAAVAGTLATLFEDRITSQINRSCVALQLLPVGPGEGKNLQWSARFGTDVGESIADGADVQAGDYKRDSKVPASLDYGTYHAPFAVTGKALAGALVTGNPAELAALFADELGDAIERLAKGIQTALYTGDGTTDNMFGLCATGGPLATTGTYAGIDRSTYPQWASNVDDNGGTPRALTLDLMRDIRTEVYEACGMPFDLILTTPALHAKYSKLIGQERRWVDNVRLRGGKITLDAGFHMLEFDGVPVVRDVDVPTGEMLFLNSEYLKVCQMPDGLSAVNQSMAMAALVGSPEDQFGEGRTRLTARINPLGRTGDKYKFQLILYPQLKNRRPNAHGRIIDLDANL